MKHLKIGKLAQITGISIDTIRYYERRGILPEPERLASGYRVYTEATINRISMAKSLQALGFTLDEIKLNLNDLDDGELNCTNGEARMQKVLSRVETRIDELMKVRNNIQAVLTNCRSGNCRLSER